jgi:hypothetical protein
MAHCWNLYSRWRPHQRIKERPSPHPPYQLPSAEVTPDPPTFSLDTTFKDRYELKTEQVGGWEGGGLKLKTTNKASYTRLQPPPPHTHTHARIISGLRLIPACTAGGQELHSTQYTIRRLLWKQGVMSWCTYIIPQLPQKVGETTDWSITRYRLDHPIVAAETVGWF